MDYITLMGAEDVQRAGSKMQEAASEMQRAAGNMSYAFEQHQRFLDDWLSRLNDCMDKMRPKVSETNDEGGV